MKFIFSLASFMVLSAFSSISYAGIVVNLPLPAKQLPIGSSGYFLNATPESGLIYLDILSDSRFAVSGSQIVAVTLSTMLAAGDEIPLTSAVTLEQGVDTRSTCVESVQCLQGPQNGQLRYLSAIYTPKSVLEVSFSLADLCSTPGVAEGPNSICNSEKSAGLSTRRSQIIGVILSVIDLNTVSSPLSGGNGENSFAFVLSI
jgi:hypothetical protein